jgi:ribosomal protein S21
MSIIKAEVKLDLKKCTDKAYFDKMYNKFNREVLNSGILDELRLKRRFYKPSAFRKIKKEMARNKWRHLL